MLARRLTEALVLTTFLLVLLGGLVHTQGASLACPDWPLCYGMVMPPMEGDILLEHGHRLLASALGLMTIALSVAIWRGAAPLRAGVGALSLVGIGLVVFQGSLGGLTVLLRLPPPVSIAHWGTSMVFFAWAIVMLVRVHELTGATVLRPAQQPIAGRSAVMAAAGFVWLQGILGSAVRHTHASMSCGPYALFCGDGLLPHTGPQWLQTSHRLSALVALVVVGVGIVPALKAARRASARGVRRAGIAAHALLLLQIAMGVVTVRSSIQLHSVMTHVAGAALLWGTLVAMAALMRPLPRAAMQAQPASTGATAPLAAGRAA